jgi:hypothetical protein
MAAEEITAQITQALHDGPLPAKEIAKNLGVERSTVNKILYKRNDVYVKDDASPPNWRIHEMWKPPQILPDGAQGTFRFLRDEGGNSVLELTPLPGQDIAGVYGEWGVNWSVDVNSVIFRQ